MKKEPTDQDKPQWCSVRCACGESHGQHMTHYGRVKAACGEVYWALQPKRGGPLELRKWPGFPGMTREQSIQLLNAHNGF